MYYEYNEIKDTFIKAIEICKKNGVRPGYRYWNVECRPLVCSTINIENGCTLTSYHPADDAKWSCQDGNRCDVLECLLLVEQPKYVEGWFHHHYFEALLNKSYEWVNSFMAGFDNDDLKQYDWDAFLLGLEIKTYLKVKK